MSDFMAIEVEIRKLASDLVKVPSRGGVDATGPILKVMEAWLSARHLRPVRLQYGGNDVALLVKVMGEKKPERAIALNACLDTAEFGDPSRWSFSPTAGTFDKNKLMGRGAADSKIGAAMFAHLAWSLSQIGLPNGTLYLLFDVDEHTGRFGGVRSFVERAKPVPRAVVLGYPGNTRLIVGARGFYRAQIDVFGRSAHSGSANKKGINAIGKLASLVCALETTALPSHAAPSFPLSPTLTVSEVQGGGGYSLVPDKASCRVDIRLTPIFDKNIAAKWLNNCVRSVDEKYPSPTPTIIRRDETWPAYRVDERNSLVQCFLAAAEKSFGRRVPTEICGPSNIGNYLATRGIAAICGLGVDYENLHSLDEVADLTTLQAAYRTYQTAVEEYLGRDV